MLPQGDFSSRQAELFRARTKFVLTESKANMVIFSAGQHEWRVRWISVIIPTGNHRRFHQHARPYGAGMVSWAGNPLPLRRHASESSYSPLLLAVTPVSQLPGTSADDHVLARLDFPGWPAFHRPVQTRRDRAEAPCKRAVVSLSAATRNCPLAAMKLPAGGHESARWRS